MTVICSAKNNNKTKKQVTIVARTPPKRKFFSQWEEYSFSLSYDCTLWSKFPVMNENENSCFSLIQRPCSAYERTNKMILVDCVLVFRVSFGFQRISYENLQRKPHIFKGKLKMTINTSNNPSNSLAVSRKPKGH